MIQTFERFPCPGQPGRGPPAGRGPKQVQNEPIVAESSWTPKYVFKLMAFWAIFRGFGSLICLRLLGSGLASWGYSQGFDVDFHVLAVAVTRLWGESLM